MKEAWDRRPSPFRPALVAFTIHMTPETGRLHATRHGSDCWCEEGCCRIIAHVPEGMNG